MNKEDLEFINVVAKIKNRVAVKSYYFEDLPQQLRKLAFTVSDLETLNQVKIVQKSLENARNEGLSFSEWRNQLDLDAVRNLSSSRLETVYRTNMTSVYNNSTRYNAASAGVTPYLMFDAVGDSRTRASHQELDGIIKRADHPFWNKYTPPLGYNCRCGVIPLSQEDAEARGITSENAQLPEPDRGFGDGERIGDMSTGVTAHAQSEIQKMNPNSPFRKKFEDAQKNTESLVDVWWQKNKNIFED